MLTQDTGQPEQDDRIAKLQWYGRVFTAAMVLLALAGLIAVYLVTTRHPQTDDAEIFANYIGIAPVVEGPILHLNVVDNQPVKRGDLLFEIDDRPYKYALDRSVSDQATLEGQVVDEQRRIQSEVHAVTASGAATRSASANVDRAQALIREAEADVAHSGAALDRAKAESAYAENNLHRVEPLLAKQYVTVDQVDQARTTERASAQSVHEAESQLALNRAHLNTASPVAVQRTYPRSPGGATPGTGRCNRQRPIQLQPVPRLRSIRRTCDQPRHFRGCLCAHRTADFHAYRYSRLVGGREFPRDAAEVYPTGYDCGRVRYV
jgi:multidrug resistance efflux pump